MQWLRNEPHIFRPDSGQYGDIPCKPIIIVSIVIFKILLKTHLTLHILKKQKKIILENIKSSDLYLFIFHVFMLKSCQHWTYID